jgi:hypothetical protein
MEKQDLKQQLLDIGFVLKEKSVVDTFTYDLGRDRVLFFSNISTQNEYGYIGQLEDNATPIYDDVVCIHNYDYDGYITIDRVMLLIYSITNKSLLVK